MAKRPGTPAFLDRNLDAVTDFLAANPALEIAELVYMTTADVDRESSTEIGGKITAVPIGTPPGGEAGGGWQRQVVVDASTLFMVRFQRQARGG